MRTSVHANGDAESSSGGVTTDDEMRTVESSCSFRPFTMLCWTPNANFGLGCCVRSYVMSASMYTPWSFGKKTMSAAESMAGEGNWTKVVTAFASMTPMVRPYT